MLTKTKLADGTVHKLPADMQKLILANQKMKESRQDITPLARNEWICWVTTCAKQETRDKPLVAMKDKMLKKGMRRPCCWVGCIHRNDKALSPSVRGVLQKRGKL
jgi:hypothetical protein